MALGIVFWGLLSVWRSAPTSVRYFLWLSMTVNGLIFAGYLAIPTLFGYGDWFEFIQGLVPEGLWREAIIVIGVILYVGVAFLAVHELEFLQSRVGTERWRRAWILNLVPYLSGGVAYVLAGLFNPVGVKLILISAVAASFGGTSAFLWLPTWSARKSANDNTPQPPNAMPRNWIWITAGGLA
ncbi:MAG: hypothetical protein ABI947_26645 [Chloroflexota bacterium]